MSELLDVYYEMICTDISYMKVGLHRDAVRLLCLGEALKGVRTILSAFLHASAHCQTSDLVCC